MHPGTVSWDRTSLPRVAAHPRIYSVDRLEPRILQRREDGRLASARMAHDSCPADVSESFRRRVRQRPVEPGREILPVVQVTPLTFFACDLLVPQIDQDEVIVRTAANEIESPRPTELSARARQLETT